MTAAPREGDPSGEAGSGTAGELARLAAEIAARVRPACRDWCDAEFDALVRKIARTKLRWAEAERRDGPPRA